MIWNSSSKRARRVALVSTVMFLTLFPAQSRAQAERQVLVHPTPVYPEFARRMALTGVVKVRVVIAPDGKIKEARVIGGHPVLVDAVQTALKEWRYAPASGETVTTLEFQFHP